MLLLALLRRSLEQFAHFTALVRLIKQPILILCFHDFLLNAVDNAKRDEQVVAVRAEILSSAVQTPRTLCGGAEEGLRWMY